jgi:CRP-like cAMP-binding protein
METASLARSLKEHKVVSELKEEHVEFLAGCTKNVRYEEGEYLFREGEQADHAYLLRKGKISLEIYDPTRGTIVVESVHAGEVLGWSVLFPPYHWHLDAKAVKDTLVFAIDGKCLRDKLDRDHSFGYAFTRLMLRVAHLRLDRLRLQILDVYKADT